MGRELSAVSRIETGASSIPADDLPVVLEAYDATPLDFAYAPTQFGPQGGLVIWLPDDYFVPPTKRQRKIKPNEDLML